MPEPITTNTVKPKPRPQQGQPRELQVILGQNNPPKKMDTTYDEGRYPGVIKRQQRVGLPPLQTQDLRAMAENKKRIQALVAQREAKAKLAAAKKPAAKAPKVTAKGGRKKGK